MSKYGFYSRLAPPKPRPWKIHPVWRGIGCLIMLLFPLLSYAGAVLLVDANFKQHWVPVPAEFFASYKLPYVGVVPHLLGILVVTILLMFVSFAGLMVLYAVLYRLIGPPTLGPLDVPVERTPQKRRR